MSHALGRRHGERRRPRFTVALAAATAGVLATAAPASALGPSVSAGAQARPDTGFVTNVRDCTHWVSAASGSDDNPGTASLPWATIGKALNSLTAGQTACVHADGTYYEDQNRAANEGSASGPIAIKGAPGEPRPVVRSTADKPPFDLGPRADYWLIEGFEIDKATRDGNAVRVNGTDRVVVRNNLMRDGKGGAAMGVYNDATDVEIRGNEIRNMHRWVDDSTGAVAFSRLASSYKRADANGVVVERVDSSPAPARVLVKAGHIHDNGGDGVACLRGNDTTEPKDDAVMPRDLMIEDVRNNANAENAVDVKTCKRVSIRGSVAPDQSGSAAASQLYGYRPTDPSADRTGNHSGGGAIVIHLYARDVLIENTRIWDSCEGIAVGREDYNGVQDVILRRNLFFDMVGPATGGSECDGNGIRATLVNQMDVYHNTLDGVPNASTRFGSDNGGPSKSINVDFWNNILKNSGTSAYWIDLYRARTPDFESDYNVFWNTDGLSSHFKLDFNRENFSEWRRVTGEDDHSVVADPLFIADPQSNGYYTQSGSPARDAALNNVGSRYCGAAPDIGFRESGC